MIIYRDIISGDEMFSDIYKITSSKSGILIEVEGTVVCRSEGIDDQLLGGNASAVEQTEGNESITVSGVDIVLNSKLQETHFNKDNFKTYLKTYIKALKTKLEESNPERVKPFVEAVTEDVKKIMENRKNYQFFTGESMNPDGIVGMLDYRDDGITPFLVFFKDGLEIEKC